MENRMFIYREKILRCVGNTSRNSSNFRILVKASLFHIDQCLSVTGSQPDLFFICIFWGENFINSRHNQSFVSWFAQESVDEHRRAGEVVNVPGSAFINAEPKERKALAHIKKKFNFLLRNMIKTLLLASESTYLCRKSFWRKVEGCCNYFFPACTTEKHLNNS